MHRTHENGFHDRTFNKETKRDIKKPLLVAHNERRLPIMLATDQPRRSSRWLLIPMSYSIGVKCLDRNVLKHYPF